MRSEENDARQVNSRSRAFSLIEVVVAVGIFAISMVAILALFAPVARSVGSSAEAEVAARVADALRLKLQSIPFATVAGLLKVSTPTGHEVATNDARADYDLTRDTQLIFANRDGTKVGRYTDPIWAGDREKYFEITLIRNEAVSPKPSSTSNADGSTSTVDSDATAAALAYTARLRWPAFLADGTQFGANPAGSVRFDHGKKQVLFFAGAVLR